MKSLIFFMLLSSLLVLICCKQAPDTPATEALVPTEPATKSEDPPAKPDFRSTDGLTLEMVRFSENTGSCGADSSSCAWVDLTYPVAKNGKAETRKAINQFVSTLLAESIGFGEEDKRAITVTQATQQFFSDYLKAKKEFMDEPESWMVESNAEVLYQNDQILSLSIEVFSYTGGAHGNFYRTIENFDLNNGKPLQITDVIADTTAFKQIAEAAFYSARKEVEEESFSKEDYFWGDPFFLPANFGITSKGILLFYNPYEAAAYALGTTEFTIPYKRVEGILRKGKVGWANL